MLRGTETIMVVDDEAALREVTRRLLRDNGYNILTCADGFEAVALCEDDSVQFDLLLTDVIMPGMDGGEVARRVRALRPGVRILFMSGYAQPVLGSTLNKDIFLLEKPYTLHSLLEKVRRALDATLE